MKKTILTAALIFSLSMAFSQTTDPFADTSIKKNNFVIRLSDKTAFNKLH